MSEINFLRLIIILIFSFFYILISLPSYTHKDLCISIWWEYKEPNCYYENKNLNFKQTELIYNRFKKE